MTQEQLANKLDIDPVTVSRFERGVALPSLLRLCHIAQTLGVTTSHLLGEGDPRKFSQIDRVTTLLEPLTEAEQRCALSFVVNFCDFLREQKRTSENPPPPQND